MLIITLQKKNMHPGFVKLLTFHYSYLKSSVQNRCQNNCLSFLTTTFKNRSWIHICFHNSPLQLKYFILLWSSKRADHELQKLCCLKLYISTCNDTATNNSFFGKVFHCDSVLDVNVILTSVKKCVNATGSCRWERKSLNRRGAVKVLGLHPLKKSKPDLNLANLPLSVFSIPILLSICTCASVKCAGTS